MNWLNLGHILMIKWQYTLRHHTHWSNRYDLITRKIKMVRVTSILWCVLILTLNTVYSRGNWPCVRMKKENMNCNILYDCAINVNLHNFKNTSKWKASNWLMASENHLLKRNFLMYMVEFWGFRATMEDIFLDEVFSNISVLLWYIIWYEGFSILVIIYNNVNKYILWLSYIHCAHIYISVSHMLKDLLIAFDTMTDLNTQMLYHLILYVWILRSNVWISRNKVRI